MYRAPIVKVPPSHLPLYFNAGRVIEKRFEDWVIRNINALSAE